MRSTPDGRRRALQELAAWPVVRDGLAASRASLIELAWRSGVHNVSELASAAQVARDVVYSDLASRGIDVIESRRELVSSVSPLTVRRESASGRLAARMRLLFARDPGLAVLREERRSASLSTHERVTQEAWARALMALHGDRAAARYSVYSSTRRLVEAGRLEPLDSWSSLEDPVSPAGRWPHDDHAFLCAGCGGCFPQVLLELSQAVCGPCARECGAVPGSVVPLWQASSHGIFATPGDDESRAVRLARFSTVGDGGHALGEIGLFAPEESGLPGVVESEVHGSVDDKVVVETVVRGDVRSYEVSAVLRYDQWPALGERHPYGLRITAATLTSVCEVRRRASRTYSDVYAMLEALIDGLYGPGGEDLATDERKAAADE